MSSTPAKVPISNDIIAIFHVQLTEEHVRRY